MSEVEVHGLVKRFGGVPALTGVDLAAPAGAVLGVLGPNGAGKTTLVRILATLLRPDGGSARIGGHDVVRAADRARTLIGLTGQYASIDPGLTGHQNLYLVARLLGASRRAARRKADELLERFDLTSAGNRLASTYSGGMRRRLDLAVSLVGTPRVLFLDEPTTGLDPRSRAELWAMVRALADNGSAVLLTTQYLEEADQLSDQIVVMDHGRVVAAGTPEELKNATGGRVLEVTPLDAADLETTVETVGALVEGAPLVEPHSRRVTVAVGDPETVPRILRGLGEAGIAVSELAVRAPSLSEAFFSLTGPDPDSVPERKAIR